MADDLAHLLRAATGAGDRFRITVFAKGDTAPVEHEFQYPYAVVGRGEGCDIVLPDSKVSFRHAYFQVIEGRVFCVDLASRNGVAWPDGPRKYGWVPPNAPIEIGPYRLQVIGEEAADSASRDSLARPQSAGALSRRGRADAESRPGIPLRDGQPADLVRQSAAHAAGPQSALQAAGSTRPRSPASIAACCSRGTDCGPSTSWAAEERRSTEKTCARCPWRAATRFRWPRSKSACFTKSLPTWRRPSG